MLDIYTLTLVASSSGSSWEESKKRWVQSARALIRPSNLD
jgi:hypothetical protein